MANHVIFGISLSNPTMLKYIPIGNVNDIARNVGKDAVAHIGSVVNATGMQAIVCEGYCLSSMDCLSDNVPPAIGAILQVDELEWIDGNHQGHWPVMWCTQVHTIVVVAM
jgi:hypothetical protein